MTPGDGQKPPGDDRKASGNDQKPDDQKVPGNNDNPPTLSEKAINQVVDGLQSAPSVQATTGVASAVRGLGSVLSPSQSLSTDPFSEIWRALEDMRIPPQHAQRLQPLFSEIGLDLKDDAVPDPDNASISRRFTTVCGEGTKIAVLHLPENFLRKLEAIGIFRHSLSNIWNRHGRLISETDWVQPGFRKSLQNDPPAGCSWMFVQWGDLQSVYSGQMKIENALALSDLLAKAKKNGAVAPPPLPAGTLDDDIEDIVKILVQEAMVAGGYFEGLIAKSDWSDALKGKVKGALSGDPGKDARALINILRTANQYGADHHRKGDTFLGWVLLGELEGLGDPAGATFAKIIVTRNLINQESGLNVAKKRWGGGD